MGEIDFYGRKFKLEAGDVFYFLPGEAHVMRGLSERWKSRWLCFEGPLAVATFMAYGLERVSGGVSRRTLCGTGAGYLRARSGLHCAAFRDSHSDSFGTGDSARAEFQKHIRTLCRLHPGELLRSGTFGQDTLRPVRNSGNHASALFPSEQTHFTRTFHHAAEDAAGKQLPARKLSSDRGSRAQMRIPQSVELCTLRPVAHKKIPAGASRRRDGKLTAGRFRSSSELSHGHRTCPCRGSGRSRICP